MKVNTKQRKKATREFERIFGRQELVDRIYQIISKGKQGLDAFLVEIGGMIAEAIMYIEREEVSGPDYRPFHPDVRKWASQAGSIYVGDQKISVEHPRLRGLQGEIALQSYQKLKEAGAFSEELLGKILRGISGQKYAETVIGAAEACGVSASTVSRHIVAVTAHNFVSLRSVICRISNSLRSSLTLSFGAGRPLWCVWGLTGAG